MPVTGAKKASMLLFHPKPALTRAGELKVIVLFFGATVEFNTACLGLEKFKIKICECNYLGVLGGLLLIMAIIKDY